ncbi:hypothetical protein R3P38DRAFT_350305 [Favolaschia claudopus]|uniref:Uncharacterized protein n=1 Tax=Favolaschia claudopus TaxID=2862362 RepID=A0AAW0CQY6_9AGAR
MSSNAGLRQTLKQLKVDKQLKAAAAQSKKKSNPKTRRGPRAKPYTRPELSAILPDDSLPVLGLPGLVIREALSWRRNQPHADNRLRRLLLGQHASQSTAGSTRNPDHLNPCREFNRYTEMFKQHCPPSRLTGPKGLANTLSWFATGQGVGTEQFLNGLLSQGGFWKDHLNGMVQQFETAVAQRGMNPNSPAYDNERAWGRQPNNNLAAQPTIKTPTRKKPRNLCPPTKRKRNGKEKVLPVPEEEKLVQSLEEKFGRLYAPEVEAAWVRHLGQLFNQDPERFASDDLPTWSATVELIKSLEIPAFKSGLTAMQMVNTLVFCGVVKMPTAFEMAHWISDNKELGAVRGLTLLGFTTRSKNDIQAAYICFHNYLDDKLTLLDKTDIGFHPPFTEHVLCKIPRWDAYLEADGCPTLMEMVKTLGDVPWLSGQNHDDSSAMPFPWKPSCEELEAALRKADKDSVC